ASLVLQRVADALHAVAARGKRSVTPAGVGAGKRMARGLPSWQRMARMLPALFVGLAVLLAGCGTSTRMMQMGPLGDGARLVTLVVPEDRAVVRQQCADIPAAGPVLGCHLWHKVSGPGGTPVLLIKIVRFTDAVPSRLALE